MSKERQKYEIYINDRLLILMSETELSTISTDQKSLIMPYKGLKKSLFQYMEILEKSSRFEQVILFAADLGLMYDDLKSLLNWVPAAGGIIHNQEKKILMIFRKGLWDLPKGKLDPNEDFPTAGLRECQEETGLNALQLKTKAGTTWHIYRDKKGLRCLKKTKWYHLNLVKDQIPVPQAEENITDIQWFTIEDAKRLSPIHKSVSVLLKNIS